MNKYVNTIFITSFISGILLTLTPEGKIKKYVQYVTSLLIVISIVGPFSNLIINITDLKFDLKDYIDDLLVTDKIQISNSLIIHTGSEKISQGIKDVILEKYNFDENEIEVELVLNKENITAIKIEKINVYITGKASWSDACKIEEYLKGLVGGDIYVKRR